MALTAEQEKLVTSTLLPDNARNALRQLFDTVGGGGLADGTYGDITVSGGGTVLTIGNGVVTNAKAADMATARIKGRVSGGTGDPEDLTGTQATTLLDVFTSALKGLVPPSGGGTTNFLRADGTFAAPASGSGNSVDVECIFGPTFTDKAQTVVTGQAWVTADSEIVAQVLTPSGTDPDEIRMLSFDPVISDKVAGDGFTVTLYSEPEAKGSYHVMCIGV